MVLLEQWRQCHRLGCHSKKPRKTGDFLVTLSGNTLLFREVVWKYTIWNWKWLHFFIVSNTSPRCILRICIWASNFLLNASATHYMIMELYGSWRKHLEFENISLAWGSWFRETWSFLWYICGMSYVGQNVFKKIWGSRRCLSLALNKRHSLQKYCESDWVLQFECLVKPIKMWYYKVYIKILTVSCVISYIVILIFFYFDLTFLSWREHLTYDLDYSPPIQPLISLPPLLGTICTDLPLLHKAKNILILSHTWGIVITDFPKGNRNCPLSSWMKHVSLLAI